MALSYSGHLHDALRATLANALPRSLPSAHPRTRATSWCRGSCSFGSTRGKTRAATLTISAASRLTASAVTSSSNTKKRTWRLGDATAAPCQQTHPSALLRTACCPLALSLLFLAHHQWQGSSRLAQECHVNDSSDTEETTTPKHREQQTLAYFKNSNGSPQYAS